ncbi:MAG TPA: Uma2 family endonuclease, partial [Archangium sp.]|nr:Uma2 family endonuclease [Archangium sp.]
MKATAKKPATYADLAALPSHLVGEIIEGELVASPRPAFDHAITSSALGGALVGPFQFGRGGPGGWWIVDEPELHLGKDVLVPDLAGCRRT